MSNSNNEIELAVELEQQNFMDVIRLYAESKTPTEIQNVTGVPIRKQREFRDKWNLLVSDPKYIEQRGKELVAELDEGYKSILKRMEEVYEIAEDSGDYKTQKEVLKELANIRKLSTEMMLKVGIVSKESVGDEIALAEQKISDVVGILKEIAEERPDVGKLIQQKLMELDDKTANTRFS